MVRAPGSSHSWGMHSRLVYVPILPTACPNACWLLLSEPVGLPAQSFLPSQRCLPRQMFYIKNTTSCPKDDASKNSLSALAFRR